MDPTQADNLVTATVLPANGLPADRDMGEGDNAQRKSTAANTKVQLNIYIVTLHSPVIEVNLHVVLLYHSQSPQSLYVSAAASGEHPGEEVLG